MAFRWLYSFVRKRTNPIQSAAAYSWRQRLSVAYAVVAWHAFGITIYMFYKGKGDWADFYGLKSEEEKSLSPGQAWANTLGIKNANVIRIKGSTKIDEYKIIDGQPSRNDAEVPIQRKIFS